MRLLLFSLIFSAFACPSFALGWTVVIDPGHGGFDEGASHAGIKEKNLVLSIAKQLKQRLKEDSHFETLLTRQKDIGLGLQERIDIAEAAKADLIVSIHANAAEDTRARGVELFIQSPFTQNQETMSAHQESQIQKQTSQSPQLSKAKDIAAILDDLMKQNKFLKSLELSEIMKQMWREQKPNGLVQIKQAPFYIITQSNIPSILVEVGFLSHPLESRTLKDSRHQRQIVDIIHRSIVKYLTPKNSDKLMAIY